MFDTMTITKAFASVCGAMLVLLLGGWAADGLYNIENHGEDHVPGYAILVHEGDDAAEPEEVVEVAFADVYAAADAGAGERLWRQCSACHALDGRDGVGPHLNGVVGRAKHSVAGFNYSDALRGLEGDWTPENLAEFLLSPRSYAPGTAMAYNGMSDVEDRANLIAYLATTTE
ncbi:c-type cytochrome [Roseicyclus persicicus]|uniref:Cytochrome c family protein n=1 Tax=Roseicyclus persicicus TaxID=2650661 RepID=A0A7X6JXS1_9RHOB|nr:cytochrome c family protein [Roseibacterium persicicum]NKX43063.1 cytochrome c family protein [Roseibacterium persicicum]